MTASFPRGGIFVRRAFGTPVAHAPVGRSLGALPRGDSDVEGTGAGSQGLVSNHPLAHSPGQCEEGGSSLSPLGYIENWDLRAVAGHTCDMAIRKPSLTCSAEARKVRERQRNIWKTLALGRTSFGCWSIQD